ncbi:MAG TPA: phenylalanine--tRNA ligase subunit beta [Candidatus Dormibacteraeota bacterium]|nr:phenylalanine--tRNA ligase subunit beta [Candidatus Dormibacteraeota bacterium]
MKVSLRWMRDYAALDAPLTTLVQALVDTGTEVEEVHHEAEGAVVARVLSLSPVPESSKGVLFADIDTGGGPVRVLTGAPNLRVGDLVPYAPPQTTLPGLDEPLGVRAMFGGKYKSPGMLCSAVELGLGDDADGIMVLDRGVPGQPLHEVLNLDTVFEVEITPNRPDCLGHVGVARELAAALGETLREPPAEVPESLVSAASMAGRVSLRVEDPVGCPRFCMRIIEDVAVGPSPGWLQRRLRTVGLRPINNVVDITNYVAAELAQPLHAFDLERFRATAGTGGSLAEVVVRRGRGERLLCLDDVERAVGQEDLVVCAGEVPVSIAGVIGGAGTAVDGATRSVLLEAASWDGPAIRATSRRLGVRTEASSRFEKGLSDTLPPLALERAAALIAELSGGRVLRDVADDHTGALPAPATIEVGGGALESILGCAVDPEEAATVLARLGFAVEQDGHTLWVTPPHFRRDVSLVVDVAEEVGRSLGYARVPATLPGRRTTVEALAPAFPLEERVRDVCIGAGYDEAITYAFLSPAQVGMLSGMGEGLAPIRLLNPLSEEWSVMRTSLLPGLCLAVATNLSRGLSDVSMFEIGRAYWEGQRQSAPLGSTPDGADRGLPRLPAEPLLLALVSQTGDGDGDTAAALLRTCQSVVAFLGRDLADAAVTADNADIPGMRAGRSGRLLMEGRDVGLLGELDSATMATLDLRGRVVVAELRLDAVAPEVPRTPRFRPPPRMPAVIRDLSVVVPDEERAGVADSVIREAGGHLLEDVEQIDEFRDPARLGPGRKAWTFRLTYRAADRTLTGAEAQPVHEAIIAALAIRCHAEVRA